MSGEKNNKSKLKNQCCDIIGVKKYMKGNVLPTKSDVLQHYLCINDKNWCGIVHQDVISIWKKAGIPIRSKSSIIRSIKDLLFEYKTLRKYGAASKSSRPGLKIKVSTFKAKINKLFDIASCTCVKNCSCSDENKIPHSHIRFVEDQRSTRKMTISKLANSKKSLCQNMKPIWNQHLCFENNHDLDEVVDNEHDSDEWYSNVVKKSTKSTKGMLDFNNVGTCY